MMRTLGWPGDVMGACCGERGVLVGVSAARKCALPVLARESA